ncbi:unnamed protein product [Moneuplotes crassus]|uniref:Uncharacterized protein n=1 Tax=Euplotes crassus TaxID=5936 RepID=A0AAD1Y3B6_EUPCR|nr:unnamed protein product [Moneuplotes crassus]
MEFSIPNNVKAGLHRDYTFNRKLCYQAYDTLNECISKQDNKNKYRCPDELYAYDQFCPSSFQSMVKVNRYRNDLERAFYDQEALDQINKEKNGAL